ncbi:MAG: thioether cross-link-forming SCIFF peptide maturase [Firmicutes bacterium]|nr:thioether cross-link-forming SCIFF peptide maturase [Bacillota bacterium]
MVHTFQCLNRYFTVDTESGSFFETDELTRILIESRQFPAKTRAGDFLRFSAQEIRDANREIDVLTREGVLFSAPAASEPSEFNGVVKSLCLNVTHLCNLRCAYCFADETKNEKQKTKNDGWEAERSFTNLYGTASGHMPLATAKAAVDFLIAHLGKTRNLEVDFFGGEPLLNLSVVKETVAYARVLEKKHNKNFRFTITTNALLLGDDATDFFNAEMDNVVLSIDGRENVHNSVRKTPGGADSFALSLKNALSFVKRRGDKKYYVRGTFTAKNLDFCGDALALADYGFTNVSIEPVVLPETHPLAIRQSHLPAILAEYEKLAGEYLARRAAGEWFTFFHFNMDVYNGPCAAKRLKSCGAGCEYLAVAPDGSLYPCHQFVGSPPHLVGNVLTGRYEKELPLRFWARNHVNSKPACQACWAKYYCSGGCAASAVKFGGALSQPHGLSCAMMQKRIECALAVYAVENG